MSKSSLDWYYKNKKRSVKKSTEWRKRNRERYLQKRRENYQKNKNRLREKSRVRAKNYYHNVLKKLKSDNPSKYKGLQKKWNNNARIRWLTFLNNLREEMGGKCSRCGYGEYIGILQFHHFNGNKHMDVASMRVQSKARVEAKKCILLCPNCHAIEHLTKRV